MGTYVQGVKTTYPVKDHATKKGRTNPAGFGGGGGVWQEKFRNLTTGGK